MAEAPYFSPAELTGMQAEPSLGGVAVNFDPAVKNPFAGAAQTFERVAAEAEARAAQKRDQVFKQKLQEQAFQNDLLAKAQAYDQQEKSWKFKQNVEDRNKLYQFLSTNRGSAFNMKDQNGNDMSFQPLESDLKSLQQGADDITQGVTSGGSYTEAMNSPEFQAKLRKQEEMKNLASMRAVSVAQLQQELAQAGTPQEQLRISNAIDAIKNTPLEDMKMPAAHQPQPQVNSLLSENAKEYPQQKGYESFEGANGESLKARPTADIESLLYTNDKKQLNQAYINARYITQLPEFQDPELFRQLQERVNANWHDIRGKEPLVLGTIGPNGQVIPNPDPRVIVAASELLNKGNFIVDSEAEKEQAEIEAKQATTRKVIAEAKEKEKELKTGQSTKPTAEELKQKRDLKEVAASAKEVDRLFSDATSKAPTNPIYPKFWERRGINVSDYTFYPPITGGAAHKYIGLEAPETDIKTVNGGKTITEKTKGHSLVPSKVIPIQNKQSGDIQLVYLDSDNNIMARVNSRDAIANGIKHEAKYDPKQYESKLSYVDDFTKNTTAPKDNNAIQSRLRPAKVRTKSGQIVNILLDPITGKRYAQP